jgi:hypothetical protein
MANETIITNEELRALLDETLLRVGPGWVFEAHLGRYRLHHPDKVYVINLTPEWGGFTISGSFRDRDLQNETYNLRPEPRRVPTTASSAKLANYLLLKIIPGMEAAHQAALQLRADQAAVTGSADQTIEAILAVAPKAYKWGYQAVQFSAGPLTGETAYYQRNAQFSATFREENGRSYAVIHGFLPPELTTQLFAVVQQYYHPEDK